MMNENREGWYIRYIQAIEPVDPQTWRLSVDGLVDNPRQLSFDDIRELPQITQKSRMKCVEGWSVAAEWMGFRPQALVDLVRPKAEATWVHFHCADDYYESLGMSELMMDRVLFAYGANGALLEPEYGLPLRLIVPFKYGYKGPKAITRISFADEQLRGFWPTMGPYTDDGQIVAGVDRALDLGTYRVFDDMGEIFYEEGLESEDR
jgi:DMSO/TMAO reductase YedYZ molybdopterin-dependent catalytic subunit